MNNKRRTYKDLYLLLLILSGMLFHSCTDDLGLVGNRPSEVLCFTASLQEDMASTSTRCTSGHLDIVEEEWKLDMENQNSRASLVTQLSGLAGIYGYSGETILNKLNNVSYTFYGDELNATDTPIYWKNIEGNVEMLDIYAYAPYSLNLGGKTFVYEIPTVDKQQDMIVAKAVLSKNNFRHTVPLTFNHALTAIRFKLGFTCTLKSIQITDVRNKGTYTIGGGWSGQEGTANYVITNKDDVLMLLPQKLPDNAQVLLTYDDNGNSKTLKASLKGQEWKPGKLITYTLYKGYAPGAIYFDLALGNVSIQFDNKEKKYKYAGKISVDGVVSDVVGEHHDDNKYYVYQSTTQTVDTNPTNVKNTGWALDIGTGKCIIPQYPLVEGPDGGTWADYITNNKMVEDVIEAWDNESNVTGVSPLAERKEFQTVAKVRDAGRESTPHWIDIRGNVNCHLTIDNLYSTLQTTGFSRVESGIVYIPDPSTKSALILNIVGDNRFGNIHYQAIKRNGTQLIFEGKGSLTVADVDFKTGKEGSVESVKGYFSNFYCSVIGNNNGTNEESYGITFNGGVIFAGSTIAENCTAIGAGGNGIGEIFLNGGTVTAVATTTGSAIGGGIGYNSPGGDGIVTITGGNVYAYNLANPWNIPSAAIGGAGSRKESGNSGTVTITGGNVYAESELGTAIGCGSSQWKQGGDAIINISGGYIIAKSKTYSAGIGGGSACTGGEDNVGKGETYNGGTAKVTITGNPIIRTGSIGGGNSFCPNGGKIGAAQINITGGDVQAQFVMAKGGKEDTYFNMYDGIIRNSNTKDNEYIHIQKNGAAVYLEDGNFTMEGGKIFNCTAVTEEGVVSGYGGAVYIKGTNNPTFTMKAGEISNCTSDADGGAIYLEGGTVTLSGGIISNNLADGGNGGGIFIKEGSFTMSDNGTASITHNSSILRDGFGGKGGGLYVTSSTKDVSVKILSGLIEENTSDRLGGGVCVEMASNSSVSANVLVGTSGTTNPKITTNHTLLSGGGLYVSGQQSNITINGGNIMENTTSAYVSNEDVANEGGMVTLNGGNVNHKVVTFYKNDGTSEFKTQNIVTATNSILVVPGFTRTGYILIGWNTRADGKGTSYANGQTMNILADMALYAQWQLKR